MGAEFISNAEAALSGEGKGGKGKALHDGLRESEENNKDLKRAHDMARGVKHDLGQSAGAQKVFDAPLGNFADRMRHCEVWSGFMHGMWKLGVARKMIGDMR